MRSRTNFEVKGSWVQTPVGEREPRPSYPTGLFTVMDLGIWRSANFMKFINLDRRISRLRICEKRWLSNWRCLFQHGTRTVNLQQTLGNRPGPQGVKRDRKP